MKYEMIFGDYEFASSTCEIAIRSGYGDTLEMSLIAPIVIPDEWSVIAMRRIIKEPKRWTVEDKKAGKLPEVGSKAVSVHDFCVVDILAVRNRCVVVCNSDVIDSRPCVFTVDNFLEIFKPIESPEEKAARLREEWVSKATFMKTYEIYDALLSGDLPVPKGGE